MELETLGELHLAWRERPDEAPEGTFGSYLGRGDGRFDAPDLSGEVTWDLFEIQHGGACDANLKGRIVAAQGGVIDFEILGFFQREADAASWRLASAVRFDSRDPGLERYRGRLGFVTGVFDMNSYRHRYRVFAAPPGVLADDGEAQVFG